VTAQIRNHVPGITLSPTGQETVLYRFQDGSDGAFPYARLVRDSAGNLYGTTISGGDFLYGTIFVVTPAGAARVCSTALPAALMESVRLAVWFGMHPAIFTAPRLKVGRTRPARCLS
jgi:uncharacterized repeat protein (TIGR03803 family)